MQSIIDEIDELEFAGEMEDAYERILLAIDAGYQTESEIYYFVNKNQSVKIERAVLQHALSCMVKSSIEVVSQGGKPDEARGGRKQIYQRKMKKISNEYLEAKELGYIDESIINDFFN